MFIYSTANELKSKKKKNLIIKETLIISAFYVKVCECSHIY